MLEGSQRDFAGESEASGHGDRGRTLTRPLAGCYACDRPLDARGDSASVGLWSSTHPAYTLGIVGPGAAVKAETAAMRPLSATLASRTLRPRPIDLPATVEWAGAALLCGSMLPRPGIMNTTV